VLVYVARHKENKMERDFTKLTQQENEVLQLAYTVLQLRGISAEEDADGARITVN
jgi:hypothetical protein